MMRTIRRLVVPVAAVLVLTAGSVPESHAEVLSGELKVNAFWLQDGACVTATPSAGGPAIAGMAGGPPAYSRTFALDVPPGTYDIAVEIGCNGPTALVPRMVIARQAAVIVAAGSGASGVDFTVQSGNATGEVVVPAGYRAAGMCLVVRQGDVVIETATKTTSDGFMVGFLPPGRYALRIDAASPGCSGQAGLRSPTVPLVIENDSTGELPPIVLSADAASAAKPLPTSKPEITAVAVTQQVSAPAPGVATQTGTFIVARTARASDRACTGTTRIRAAGNVTLRCRLTAAAKAAQREGAVRIRLVTTLRANGVVYRAQRTVVLPAGS